MKMLNKEIMPTNDLAFRKIFTSEGNERILAGLIRDFCGIEANNVTILNPYNIKTYKIKNHVVLSQNIHDVLAVADGINFAMEMQNQKSIYERERFMLYISNAYPRGFGEGNNAKSPYSGLRQLYALNILGYNAFDDENSLRYESILTVCHHVCFELTKKFKGTDNQHHWYIFFNTGQAAHDAPNYIKDAARFFEDMKLGKRLKKEEVIKMNATQEAKDYMYRVTEAAIIEGKAVGEAEGRAIGEAEGRAIGEAEGRAIGEAEGEAKVAQNMLKSGMPIEEVLKFTSLSKERLEELRESQHD